MSLDHAPEKELTLIRADAVFTSNLGELWRYRDLLIFMVWRDIRSRYAQSILGIGWAIIQPLFTMIVFTVVFGNLAEVDSDGQPYAIFSFAAVVPWTYFAGALGGATGSLVGATSLLNKVYFPRTIIPLTAVIGKLVDFLIASVILMLLLLYFRADLQESVVFLPVLVTVMVFSALGLGLWLTALAVRYRDVKHLTPFGIQILMYLSPVVYALSAVPKQYQWIYSLNPMVGVIEGFRSALLGTRPMPWFEIAEGTLVALLLLVSGWLYFRKTERSFADVA